MTRTLSDFLERVYLPDRPGLSPGYIEELRRTVRQFGDPPLSELSKPLLADFMRRFPCPVTANNKRMMVAVLWRQAAQDGLAPPMAAPRRMPAPEEEPTAWTVEEVGELLWTAGHWPGAYCGVPARLWWPSLFATAYWTAARVGTLLAASWCDYGPSGLTVWGRSQKNRRGKRYRLPPHCREKLDAMPRGDGPIWPWPYGRPWLFNRARAIIERAGLEAPRTGMQLFHRLRRTSLSYCAVYDLDLAQRQAGHASSATTLRHYIAPAIATPITAADVLPVPQF